MSNPKGKIKEKDYSVQIPSRIRNSILNGLKEEVRIENERRKAEGLHQTNLRAILECKLQQTEAPVTPALAATVQDVVNTAEELVGEFSPDKISVMREKVKRVWKQMK